MIDEFYYDELAETMVELWSEIESELIEEIARRIKKSLRITSTAEFELTKLQQANLLNKRAVEIISKKADISQGVNITMPSTRLSLKCEQGQNQRRRLCGLLVWSLHREVYP
ncbi:MAG: hypothetical protein E7558_09095 [Ruminococcaceae bacterium]|nr:hypothetical protein [Oscillospiraceae bacterium]